MDRHIYFSTRMFLLMLMLWMTPWCVIAQNTTASRPLRVVATFSILHDMASQVGGPQVEATALVGPDSDAHVYEPTAADVRTLAAADLLIANGLGFEHWLQRLTAAAGYKRPLLIASTGIDVRLIPETRDTDPHAWQDLKNGQRYVDNIAQVLSRLDPANAPSYRRRAQAYRDQLGRLDRSLREQFAQVPPQRRRILTSHDAFGYFASAYGIQFIGARRWNTATEASAHEIAALVRLIRKERVSAVFMENITDPRLIETVSAETGTQVGGTLYSDALSHPGKPAATYLLMMQHNSQVLLQALNAPPAR